MSLREIIDEHGTLWQVFEVHPVHESEAAVLKESFIGGWLCFLSERGRRRVAPIPGEWEAMNDHALRRLLSIAPPTGESPRLTKN